MTLLAERGSVTTSHVLVAGIGGPSHDAALAVRPTGHPPGQLDAAELTDDVLDALFTTMLDLRRARIAHRSLSGETILVDPAGASVAVVDFRTASPSPAKVVWTPTWPGPWPPRGRSPVPSGRPPPLGGCCRRRRWSPRCPIYGEPVSIGSSRPR